MVCRCFFLTYAFNRIRGIYISITNGFKKSNKSDSLVDVIVEQPQERIEIQQNIYIDISLKKYWNQRYRYFSKFDEGIKIDNEGIFSVTPECIAKHIANICACDTIIDPFCGVGGNAIQFAFTCKKVIAIDINPLKIEYAKNNARIYGVEDRITFIVGDFFKLAPTLKADVVFLSPPWGGPNYIKVEHYDINNMMLYSATDIWNTARTVTENIAFYLPKNTNILQLKELCEHVNIEYNYIKNGRRKKIKAITAYFGELAFDYS